MGAYYPPEFLHVREMPTTIDEADSPYVTSKTDIFHLDLMLWLLAENKTESHASPLCRRNGCRGPVNKSKDDNSACNLSHAEPIMLPRLSESIPKYFRDMVDACRREDPGTRPAAREILEMFPFAVETSSDHQKYNQHEQGQGRLHLLPEQNRTPDADILADSMCTSKAACSLCSKRPLTTLHLPFYRCNSCSLDDFDLCQSCYDRGLHCFDDNHVLVELGKIGSWVVPRRYHSCIKDTTGKRDVIDL